MNYALFRKELKLLVFNIVSIFLLDLVLDYLFNNSFYYFYYVFSFIFTGLLIAANPYLAVKVYPENQNVWQDCYEHLWLDSDFYLPNSETSPSSRQTVVVEQIKAPSVY